jgi:cytochrome bd-type quinol oxidase subunit 2
MKKLKRILASAIVALGFAVPMLAPVAASAAPDVNANLCAGANLTFSTKSDVSCAGDAEGDAGTSIDSLITTIINILSLVVGVVSVIMIIIGGLRYITSNGDSGNVTNAKNTILYAIVGLVIVALAQLIVRFVVQRLTDTPT